MKKLEVENIRVCHHQKSGGVVDFFFGHNLVQIYVRKSDGKCCFFRHIFEPSYLRSKRLPMNGLERVLVQKNNVGAKLRLVINYTGKR